jgi:penicillin-binding protein 1C
MGKLRLHVRSGACIRGLIASLIVLLALAACTPTNRLGSRRPAPDTLGSVEAYLARYQPGPKPRLFQTTRLYDRSGAPIAELWNEGRRTWVGLDRISKHLIDATIATEDATFYQNTGIDPARIAAAALRNTQEGEITSGASTITMQLARNLFLGPDQRYDQTMDRKMLEAGLAQELTHLFSKDELLEMYLNLLNYGHWTYGPEAASQVYFGKRAADLSPAEATLLAGIPQRPADFDLFTDFAAAKARQRVVLDMMVRHDYLTEAQADTIHAQLIKLNPRPDQSANLAPHFVQFVQESLDARLGGEGVTRRSGLQITTTLDLKAQTLAQEIVKKKVAELKPAHDLSNAAVVALRPGTFEIVAMVGSADFGNAAIAGQVNVAISRRQPGSAIKPVLYAAAISDTLISPATVLWDIPVTYTAGAGMTYAPVNYDGKSHGPVTARTALANSLNVPAVKLLDGVTVDRMLAAARDLGIQSLSRDRSWYGLSLTLGGGEVTLLELTGAFAALANGGRYAAPTPVLALRDPLGRPVDLPGLTSAQLRQAVSPAAAFLVTDILSDNTARTPMFGPNSVLKLSKPAAAKTGTTTDYRDNWTVGYTRHLVTGVWAGNSDGRPMKNTTGLTGAAPIWHDFMEATLADAGLLSRLASPKDGAGWDFAPPADVERRSECPPGLACREGGEFFSKAWLAAAGQEGPLADSVVSAPTAPVYVKRGDQGKWAAYCEAQPAAVRKLLRLPDDRLGFAQPKADEKVKAEEKVKAASEVGAPVGLEARHVIAWALRHPTAVDLGPCDKLGDNALAALALMPEKGDEGAQVLVDLAAAMDPNAGPVAGDTAQPVTAAPPAPAGPGAYGLAQPVTHHRECPGNYIMGRVLNAAGGPVAGVRLTMVDQWGNRAEAVSKSGATDYGSYDFPLNPFANRYTVTVVDGSGRPISAPVTVEHLQGAGNAPCHTVIWWSGG